MEEVIECPTMVGQAGMLEGKMALRKGAAAAAAAEKRGSSVVAMKKGMRESSDERQQQQVTKFMTWARAKTARLSVIGVARKSTATTVVASS
jgi:replication-associated recombination protein RarA